MSLEWLWGILLVPAMVLLAVAGTLLARRWVGVEVLKLNNEVAGFIYAVIGVVYAQAEVEGIKREAGIERESRIAILVAVIFGAVFSLLALFIERSVSIGLSIATIFLSWLLIHTVFAIYYAHEFHSEARAGTRGGGGSGLKFPGDPTPDYLDFLYFSFVVGTTNLDLRHGGHLARHSPRCDDTRHLVVLPRDGGDRAGRQSRSATGAGLKLLLCAGLTSWL